MPQEYFNFLIDRFTAVMYGEASDEFLPHDFDWRFHEYPNAVTHVMYTSCVELMTIKGSAEEIMEGLLQPLKNVSSSVSEGGNGAQKRLNCVALCLSAMPGRYFAVLLNMLHNSLTVRQ